MSVPRVDDRTATAVDGLRPLRGWSLAALLANAGIVVTGGIVRVTASGLGCPTWPTCEEGSVLPTAAGDHGWRQLVEFGNRTLTGVVLVAVVGALLAARRTTPAGDGRRVLAGWLVAGVAGQALVGGVTVLLDLHPLIVATHFLLSMVLIALATVLHARAVPHVEPRRVVTPPPGDTLLAAALLGLAAVVLVLGTVVTATGPHAGDPGTPRLDLPLVWVARSHTAAVWATVAVTVLLLVRSRSRRGHGADTTARWAALLLVVEVGQGGVGYWQYAAAVPPRLVILHMALACLFWVVCIRTALSAGVLGGIDPGAASQITGEPATSASRRARRAGAPR